MIKNSNIEVLLKNNIELSNLILNTSSPYVFNFDLVTLKDTVTGKSLTTVISGTRYDEVNGVVTSFGSNVPTVTERGLRTVGSYTNLILQSQVLDITPWISGTVTADTTISPDGTQTADTINITAAQANKRQIITTPVAINDSYIFSIYLKSGATSLAKIGIARSGTGTYEETTSALLTLTENYQRLSIKRKFVYTQTGEVVTIQQNTNDPTNIIAWGGQVTKSTYLLPYIPTTSSTYSSPSEAGSADSGNKFNNLSTNFPALKTALESKGTLTLNWTPGFNKADVSGELNILSFDSSTNHLRYDATNGAIELYDGTNVVSVALDCVANTNYTIKATWEGSSMKLWVGTTAGTIGTFAGSFATGDMVIGLNNNELQYVKDIKVLKQPTWE